VIHIRHVPASRPPLLRRRFRPLAALGAVVSAATELREQGTYGFRAGSAAGAAAARRAFS